MSLGCSPPPDVSEKTSDSEDSQSMQYTSLISKNLRCKMYYDYSSSSLTASNRSTDENNITLVVENTRFVVNPNLFVAHPDTMLGRMFAHLSSGASSMTRPNDKGEYHVAEGISSNIFAIILLRTMF